MGLLDGGIGLGMGTGMGTALSFKPDQSELKMNLAQQQASNKAAQLANDKADAALKFVYENSKMPDDIPPAIQDEVHQRLAENTSNAMYAMRSNGNNISSALPYLENSNQLLSSLSNVRQSYKDSINYRDVLNENQNKAAQDYYNTKQPIDQFMKNTPNDGYNEFSGKDGSMKFSQAPKVNLENDAKPLFDANKVNNVISTTNNGKFTNIAEQTYVPKDAADRDNYVDIMAKQDVAIDKSKVVTAEGIADHLIATDPKYLRDVKLKMKSQYPDIKDNPSIYNTTDSPVIDKKTNETINPGKPFSIDTQNANLRAIFVKNVQDAAPHTITNLIKNTDNTMQHFYDKKAWEAEHGEGMYPNLEIKHGDLANEVMITNKNAKAKLPSLSWNKIDKNGTLDVDGGEIQNVKVYPKDDRINIFVKDTKKNTITGKSQSSIEMIPVPYKVNRENLNTLTNNTWNDKVKELGLEADDKTPTPAKSAAPATPTTLKTINPKTGKIK